MECEEYVNKSLFLSIVCAIRLTDCSYMETERQGLSPEKANKNKTAPWGCSLCAQNLGTGGGQITVQNAIKSN